ncbi:hypothetical protein BvL003_09565 [Bacillus velezensis]|nr:hypothetical protein BvL003_09565 [Bacillus velezensis]
MILRNKFNTNRYCHSCEDFETLFRLSIVVCKGNPPCDHPNRPDKEYYLGTSTGDYVCSIFAYSGHKDSFKYFQKY